MRNVLANWNNIYTVILILLMLLSAFAAAFKLRWLVVIAGLGLGLFAGLRGPSVGPDTIVYYKHAPLLLVYRAEKNLSVNLA